MTIKQYIKEKGWQMESDTELPYRSMDVDISFQTDGIADETQFHINAYDVNELTELFSEFCKENNIPNNTVTSINIVQIYAKKA